VTAPPGLEQALEPGAAERYLLFELATGIYALPVILLRELAEAPAITPLPLVPEWIRGLTQLRGDVLAVVDLLPFLGGEPLPDQASNRLLVVGGQAGGAQAGILVPRVLGTAAVPLGDLAPPTASRRGGRRQIPQRHDAVADRPFRARPVSPDFPVF
jgi:purine-binding chemotaxis protein CheW